MIYSTKFLKFDIYNENLWPDIELDQSGSRCECKTSLENAIITPPEARDKDLGNILEAVSDRLLNST